MAKKDYSGKNIVIEGLKDEDLLLFTIELTKLLISFGATLGGGWIEYTENEDEDVQKDFERLSER